MRPNPAYHALDELRRDRSFPHKITSMTDQNQLNYFLVEFDTIVASLTLAGQTYRAVGLPHLSCYQRYRANETRGLSVMHITCYWRQQQNDSAARGTDASMDTQIVLRAYFSRVGTFLYCIIKNRDTNEVIEGITPTEQANIRRVISSAQEKTFTTLFDFITRKRKNAEKITGRQLAALEELNLRTKQQRQRYFSRIKTCITTLEEKDRWCFESRDPQISWLKGMMAYFADEQKSTLEAPQRLFSTEKNVTADAASTAEPVKRNPSTAGQRRQTLQTALQAIDEEIHCITADNTGEAAVIKSVILDRKLTLLGETEGRIPTDIELAVLTEISEHRAALPDLFKKNALEGNLAAVEALTPYIKKAIDTLFVADMVFSDHVEVCHHLLQHFDEFLFTINHVAYFTENGTENTTIPLLYKVLNLGDDSLAMFQMLLENGADANFRGMGLTAKTTLLNLAAEEGLLTHARLLLEHGAKLIPDKIAIPSQQPRSKTRSGILREIHRIEENTKDSDFERISQPPFLSAVRQGSPDMVRLFLEFGASLDTRCDGFDAIGTATCQTDKPLNREVVKVLLEYGGDINSIQQAGDVGVMTALDYQIQCNDRPAVNFLLRHGADPNTTTIGTIGRGPIATKIHSTPFQNAAIRQRTDILADLISDTQSPITLTTLTTTMAFCLSDPNYYTITLHQSISTNFKLNSLTPSHRLLIHLADKKEDSNEEMQEVISKADKNARVCFGKKQYHLAFNYFHVALFFGSGIQKFDSLYNLGGCARHMNGYESTAKDFFLICESRHPYEKTRKNAALHLARIRGAGNTETKNLSQRSFNR